MGQEGTRPYKAAQKETQKHRTRQDDTKEDKSVSKVRANMAQSHTRWYRMREGTRRDKTAWDKMAQGHR